jgi:histidine triad (HIT) family protein
MATTDCVFCRIVAGDAPATIVAKWPDAIAIRPLGPVVPGHVLVIPRVHVWSFIEDPVVSAVAMHRAAEFASKSDFPGDGVNLITSAGDAATQTVFHMHVHLVPREDGDSISLPWDVRHG